jgi:hypothetical protein
MSMGYQKPQNFLNDAEIITTDKEVKIVCLFAGSFTTLMLGLFLHSPTVLLVSMILAIALGWEVVVKG